MSRTVSLLNRFEDPETSSDPRVRALVEKLSRVNYAPAPRPEFRSELRQQLVAIAGRVVTEGEPVAVPSTAGPAMLDPVEAAHAARSDADSAAGSQWANVSKLERPARRRKDSSDRRVRRPVGLAAACVAVLVLGFSGTVWKSRSALPGDSLYGLKRASENVQLDLTTGNTARGHEYLKLATTRVQEAKDLLGQTSAMASGSGDQAGGLSPQTVSLIRSTLRSANSDVTSGSSLLGTEAVKSHSARPLTIMTKWAPTELVKLKMLATAIGTGPAHASTLHSWTVVHSALARARTLTPQVTRSCAAAPTDNYGPKSCTKSKVKASPSTSAPQQHRDRSGRHPTSATHPTQHVTHAKTHSTHGSTPPTGAPGTHHAKRPTGSGSSAPPTHLPTSVPTKIPTLLPSSIVPSLPISINSCGISAGLGIISVGIGSCPSGH